jgi:hypothetical protein
MLPLSDEFSTAEIRDVLVTVKNLLEAIEGLVKDTDRHDDARSTKSSIEFLAKFAGAEVTRLLNNAPTGPTTHEIATALQKCAFLLFRIHWCEDNTAFEDAAQAVADARNILQSLEYEVWASPDGDDDDEAMDT